MMTPEQNRIRGLIAAGERHHPDDTDTLTDLRRELRFSRLLSYIEAKVNEEPSLSMPQRQALSHAIEQLP